MLYLESTGNVGLAAARTMIQEAASIHREWWRGNLGLEAEDESKPSPLFGRVPLFRPGGVPEGDDLFMAFSDAVFIVEHLRDWSFRFKVKWHLRMHDEEWGAIDPTGCSKLLLDQMDKWARRVGLTPAGRGRWPVPEERRLEILSRYRRDSFSDES